MNTITWGEISEYLDSLIGTDLISVVSKLKDKFEMSDTEANSYLMIYMGYSN